MCLGLTDLLDPVLRSSDHENRSRAAAIAINGDTFSISALHLVIKVPYFSNSWHKNEKVTSYLQCVLIFSGHSRRYRGTSPVRLWAVPWCGEVRPPPTRPSCCSQLHRSGCAVYTARPFAVLQAGSSKNMVCSPVPNGRERSPPPGWCERRSMVTSGRAFQFVIGRPVIPAKNEGGLAARRSLMRAALQINLAY
eukprot:SAG31_NODE_731_length_12498_cov_7.368336_5_plen_194_part_00